jgi:hypothetical protein
VFVISNEVQSCSKEVTLKQSPEPVQGQHILCCTGHTCSEEEGLHCECACVCSVLTSRQKTGHKLDSGNAAGQ